MGKKIALNVLYNVGIIISLFVGYEGIATKNYSWTLGAVFIGAILVVLKIKLVKEVRELNKRR
ncbi:hypothetical protein DJ568_11115 [Mucilaginibacter hurinus]|uniref:Uncharacterized protein n=1 Tax=Mucilaginibacter hurinus TaxID=2201324 RepID=A0A367GQM3_9SPHI|nr:DUF6358 family protein [Mucilaginibacter hurinus]RCH55013.1 hypothetical protein DJ568_11115 [Mucilaginibacter hurinus]